MTSGRTTTTTRTTTTVPSPIGPITLTAVDGVLSGVYTDAETHRPSVEALGTPDPAGFQEAAEQLRAWFAGETTDFGLATHPVTGTPFQRRVWAALEEIGYGQTATYGEIAAAVGRPTAVRAVGAANGRNPLCIVVPCHRVVGADGSLTGYSGGIERKSWLLEHEQRVLAAR